MEDIQVQSSLLIKEMGLFDYFCKTEPIIQVMHPIVCYKNIKKILRSGLCHLKAGR